MEDTNTNAPINKRLGRHWKLSPETKARLSAIQRNKSKLQRQVSSERMLVEVECPHCGKIGQRIAMLRWHFDNCAHAPVPQNT